MQRWLFLGVLLVALPFLPILGAQTDSGLAGSYSDRFSGKTASGEKYDPAAFTAAASDLRLGMRLAVTNTANDRTVTVRVNDNRPLSGGRIVDLSRAAAQALGLEEGGTIRVEIRALRIDEPDVTKIPPVPVSAPLAPTPQPQQQTALPPPPETYFQMGAFRTEVHAQTLARSLERQGDLPRIFKERALFHVYLVVKETDAPVLIEKLTKEGRIGFFQVSREPAGTSVKLTTE
jgi:rare lipoprotein A